MKQKKSGYWHNNKIWILSTIGVLVGYVILYFVGLAACPFKAILGITCPGCGITRALFSLISLDFASAFFYHPLWPAFFIVAFLMIFFHAKKMMKAFEITGILAGVAAFAVYFYRLFFTDSFVVEWNIEGGLLYRSITGLIEMLTK